MKKSSTKVFDNTDVIQMLTINTTIPISEIKEGYEDKSNEEGGIFSMNGKLNIRPRYQRAYIADTTANWRENLINSIICGFPINRLYIGIDSSETESVDNANKEMLDGQQRTKTICDFVEGAFAILYNGYLTHFHNLPHEIQERILNYQLDVTYCKGSESARIAWFKRINQPNSILTPQELRNSTWVGEWLENLKKYFCSSSSSVRKQITDKTEKYCASYYANGCKIERCEYLEVALDWISYYVYPEMRKASADDRICRYMAEHQHDTPNDDVIEHYKKVIDWANATFLNNGLKVQKYPQSFAGVAWGKLYAEYGENIYDTIYVTKRIAELLAIQSEFTRPVGLYEWILRGEKREDRNLMSPRTFTPKVRQQQFELQGGMDPLTHEKFSTPDDMEAHHAVPWTLGGTTDISNCIMLSPESHKKYHLGLITAQELVKERDALMERVRENRKRNNQLLGVA